MATAKQIWLGLYLIPCGAVNTYLIDGGSDGLVLIDAGFPGKAGLVFDGIRNIGRRPSEVRHIVLTHAHFDHIGGLAEIVKVTGAQTWMHHVDAPIAEAGRGFRPLKRASEPVPRLLYAMFYKPRDAIDPARIDHRVMDGDVIPLAGGLRVIGVPGHSAGQMALLWEGHRVLFAADACINMFRFLNSPLGWEDEKIGKQSQRTLGEYDYDLACFGHGPPLSGHASVKMARRWAVTPEEVAAAH